MKVGYIQYDVKHDREENFRIIQKYLEKRECDLVVLPELCVCGYLFENKKELMDSAEVIPDGVSTNRMLEWSKMYHCIIVFGLAERIGDKVYNTAVVVDKGTYIGKYQKIHLSDFEKKLFERGQLNRIFDLSEVKLGVQICFDLWFPEVSREQIQKGANLLCVLANFGGETTYIISQTRAIENLTPLVMSNRIGHEISHDMDAYFLGRSTIVQSDGKRICVGEKECERFDVCEIEIKQTKSNVICSNFDAEIAIHTIK